MPGAQPWLRSVSCFASTHSPDSETKVRPFWDVGKDAGGLIGRPPRPQLLYVAALDPELHSTPRDQRAALTGLGLHLPFFPSSLESPAGSGIGGRLAGSSRGRKRLGVHEHFVPCEQDQTY